MVLVSRRPHTVNHGNPRRSGSSRAPAAAWASTLPGPPWRPGMRSWPPAGTSVVCPRRSGTSGDLLAVKLDVTRLGDAQAAVRAAVDRFGRIDVLVNNAASFYAGYFEELTPEQFEQQLATSLIGPMNVTRAVLPVMRKQRSGHIISISSTAGLVGFEFGTAYAASKFGLEGWMESLAARGRAVRHQHHHRQPGVLPHRAPHGAIDQLRRAVHRGLRRAQSEAARVLEGRRTASRAATRPSSPRRC